MSYLSGGNVPNDRLRDALNEKGFTPQQLASELEVDPKTAERWVTLGRTPYRASRHRIAALVGERESYLWPAAVSDEERSRAAGSEIVHVYPHRAGMPRDLWDRLLDAAGVTLDVLVYAGLFLPEQHPGLAQTLCEKSSAGVQIRFLLGDPACEQVALRGVEEGIGDAVAAKIRNVMSFYVPLAEQGAVELRLHQTTLYSSIYRFDDEMLVNTHILGLPAAHSPVLHLRRLSAGDLFDTYANTFEVVWTAAMPAGRPATDRASAP